MIAINPILFIMQKNNRKDSGNMEEKMEIWKDIEGYENRYQVSNLGRVKSLDMTITDILGRNKLYKGKILRKNLDKKGYETIVLKLGNSKPKKHYIHQLVLLTFDKESYFEGAIIDHVNTIKTDNRLENLHWVTQKDNMNNPLTKEHMSESSKGHIAWNKGKKCKQLSGVNNPSANKIMLIYPNDKKSEIMCIREASKKLNIHERIIRELLNKNIEYTTNRKTKNNPKYIDLIGLKVVKVGEEYEHQG